MSAGDHKDVERIARRLQHATNVLAKWRRTLAGWQLGTRLEADGEFRAVSDHREATLMLRAEVNALTKILLDKGVCTQVELSEAIAGEAEHLNGQYAEKFPGFEATPHGMKMTLPTAGDTMRRLGFPP